MGFEDEGIASVARELDEEISTGKWDKSAMTWDYLRSRQVQALLQYVVKENRKLKDRITRLEAWVLPIK